MLALSASSLGDQGGLGADFQCISSKTRLLELDAYRRLLFISNRAQNRGGLCYISRGQATFLHSGKRSLPGSLLGMTLKKLQYSSVNHSHIPRGQFKQRGLTQLSSTQGLPLERRGEEPILCFPTPRSAISQTLVEFNLGVYN
jgi:hypothetical protein